MLRRLILWLAQRWLWQHIDYGMTTDRDVFYSALYYLLRGWDAMNTPPGRPAVNNATLCFRYAEDLVHKLYDKARRK